MSEEICSINSVPHYAMAIQLWEKYIVNCNAENFEAANFTLEQMKLLNLNKHGQKGENEEFQSNNESNRDKESEADKDRPEKFTDLHLEMLKDVALRPTSLTDLMIGHINRKKPYYTYRYY
ncbi:hypothetical protein TNCV_4208311 [Trichonephila clavipes]|nr:hypothetical protein TNCV_4208311 [Trichonephila clavipes]